MPSKKKYKKKKPLFEKKGYATLISGAGKKKRAALGKKFLEAAEKGEIIRIM